MIRNWGIRSRVLLLALVPVLTLGILLGAYLTRVRVSDLQASEHVLGDTLANQLASASEYGVYTNNLGILTTLAHTVVQEPGVEAITITDTDNRILVQVIQPQTKSTGLISELTRRIGTEAGLANTLTFTRSIYLRSLPNNNASHTATLPNNLKDSQSDYYQLLGKVVVKLSETHFAERQAQIVVNGGIIMIICLALSILLALVIGGSVAVPITRVIDMVRRFSAGEHAVRVSERSGGEIGRLENGINLMAANAVRSQQELQSQVNQATAELRETMEEMEIKNVELDLARKRALEASRVKSEFLANMSHEIRTPMNAIVGFSNLLEKTTLNKDQRYYLDTVQHSASILLTLIDDVLSLQSLEAGKSVVLAAFNLRELLEDTVKLLAPEAYKKELELVLNVPADFPINYMGDAVKISRVLINLLSNAVKFTEHGYIKISAHIQDIHDNYARVCIKIKDTGIGIHNEHMKDLFKPFTMLNISNNPKYPGTGLGLAISKRLMDTLGGKLSVSSQLGEGSEFCAEFKIDFIDNSTSLPVANANNHVLLYESHPEMSLAIQARLESLGFHVLLFHDLDSLAQQLHSASKETYRFLLLSLSYKNIHDYKPVLNAIKKHPKIPRLILVNSLEYRVQNQVAEALDGICLPKCVDRLVLDEKINSLTPHRMTNRTIKKNKITHKIRPLAGYKVLVVEDNRINRHLLVLQLRELGAKVSEAEDGQTAILSFTRQRPDIIVLDMRLRQETGLDVAKSIVQLAGKSPIPIVMLSATSEQSAIEKSHSLGIYRWLLKPVDERILANALLSALSELPLKEDLQHDPKTALNIQIAQLRPEIIGMLRQDLPAQQQAVIAAWEIQDVTALKQALHDLHGTAAFCGLLEINSCCSELQILLDKYSDTRAISQLMATLKAETNRVIDMLNSRK